MALRGICFSHVHIRNANVSNRRIVAYARQLGWAILVRNKKVHRGFESSSVVATI